MNAKTGRPPKYETAMKVTPVRLTAEQIAWLKAQGNLSETVRKLIDEAMKESRT